MAVRYVRDEERIAEAIKSTRRGVRDVQRPTGTERALTKEVAEQAGTDAAQAVVLAEGKLTVSPDAPLPADGVDKPVGALWMQKNVSGEFDGFWEWDGSVWAERPLSREIIPLISTAMLEADAIDGMTITGATVRTAAAGERVQLDSSGLRGFDSSNAESFNLKTDNGEFVVGLPDGYLFAAYPSSDGAGFSLRRSSDTKGLVHGLVDEVIGSTLFLRPALHDTELYMRAGPVESVVNSSKKLTFTAPGIVLNGQTTALGNTFATKTALDAWTTAIPGTHAMVSATNWEYEWRGGSWKVWSTAGQATLPGATSGGASVGAEGVNYVVRGGAVTLLVDFSGTFAPGVTDVWSGIPSWMTPLGPNLVAVSSYLNTAPDMAFVRDTGVLSISNSTSSNKSRVRFTATYPVR